MTVLPEQPDARAQRRGLRDAVAVLAEVATAGERGVLLGALGTLDDALARHAQFAESPDGLFAEVIGATPRLAHQVKRLEAEHEALHEHIDRCEAQLRVGAGVDDAIRADLADLLRAFEMHVHRGVELVYDAYNVDISAGD